MRRALVVLVLAGSLATAGSQASACTGPNPPSSEPVYVGSPTGAWVHLPATGGPSYVAADGDSGGVRVYGVFGGVPNVFDRHGFEVAVTSSGGWKVCAKPV